MIVSSRVEALVNDRRLADVLGRIFLLFDATDEVYLAASEARRLATGDHVVDNVNDHHLWRLVELGQDISHGLHVSRA